MAAKRNAGGNPAARPAKKRQGQVPKILSEALEVLPQADVLKLLKAHVLPGIVDEPFKPIFQQGIEKFQAKDEIDQLISFKSHQQSINGLAKNLKSSLRRDWHDGYEEQSAYKGQMVGEIETWLNNLFKVGIERGLELGTVQKCLIFMEKHIVAIMNDHCRSTYSESCYDIVISDSQGAAVYDGVPEYIIPYFWRDLLLTAIVKGDKALLSKFTAHCETDGEGLIVSLSHIPGPEHDKQSKRDGSENLYDSWHTAEMQAAIPQLRALLEK